MSGKLRGLYDRLYIWTEVELHAMNAAKSGRKLASSMTENPRVAEEYGKTIRPYWRRFGRPAPKRFWFTLFCGRKDTVDPRYIPDDLWFSRIVPYYNNLIFAKALQDKCLHNLVLPNIKRPETVVKNVAGVFYDDALRLLTREEAVSRCRGRGRVIVKPSVSSGQGHNIRFYDTDTLTEAETEDIFRLYGQNFIMQEKLLQHPVLAAFHPNSLNTVRVITFLHHGRVHVLSTILRIGGGSNEVDNVSQGGYQCTIMPDGRLEKTAVTKRDGKWVPVEATANGIRFSDVTVPSFARVLETVRNAASTMAHFRILGWDIAIDPEGEPVLVEFNVIPGQNQTTCGPTFGELTDEVLSEVFGRR